MHSGFEKKAHQGLQLCGLNEFDLGIVRLYAVTLSKQFQNVNKPVVKRQRLFEQPYVVVS